MEGHSQICYRSVQAIREPYRAEVLGELQMAFPELQADWECLRVYKEVWESNESFQTYFAEWYKVREAILKKSNDLAGRLATESKKNNKSEYASATTTSASSTNYLSINHNLPKTEYTHVIALVHGIRDIGAWQNTVSKELMIKRGVQVAQIRYGLFSAWRFLFPISLHGGPIRKVIAGLRNLKDEYPNAKISVIAHSFGTFVTLRAIQRDRHIRLWKIVFCGSVADDVADWGQFTHRIGRDELPTKDFVVNDCGTGDHWPVYGTAFGWFYGMAGSVGFSEEFVTNRFHLGKDGKAGSHALYFEPEFVGQKWMPFLIHGDPLAPGDGVQGMHLSRFTKLFYHPWAQMIARLFSLLVWLSIPTTIAFAMFFLYRGLSTGQPATPNISNSRTNEAVATGPPTDRQTSTEKAGSDFVLKESTNSIGMKLRLIPAGSFQMGSRNSYSPGIEKPQHRVILSEFELGVCEVTKGEYKDVMDHDPSTFPTEVDDLPVERVSWFDAIEFCNKLSDREGIPRYYEVDGTDVMIPDLRGKGYRLPTEAEWEYACRASSVGAYCFGDHEKQLNQYAWFGPSAEETTHSVGTKRPNDWHLFDMHGNVFEWCWDWYGDKYYAVSPQRDPIGPDKGSHRINRGGSWGQNYGDDLCRSARRSFHKPDDLYSNLGFRVARSSVASDEPANAAGRDRRTKQ